MSRSQDIPFFGPTIPEGVAFDKNELFREFILTKSESTYTRTHKVINACDTHTHTHTLTHTHSCTLHTHTHTHTHTHAHTHTHTHARTHTVINACNASLRSEKFSKMAVRTRKQYLNDLAEDSTTNLTLDQVSTGRVGECSVWSMLVCCACISTPVPVLRLF